MTKTEQLRKQAAAIAFAEERLTGARRKRDAETKRELPSLVLELMLGRSWSAPELVKELESLHLFTSEADVDAVLHLLVSREQVEKVGNRFVMSRPGVLSQHLSETPKAPRVE